MSALSPASRSACCSPDESCLQEIERVGAVGRYDRGDVPVVRHVELHGNGAEARGLELDLDAVRAALRRLAQAESNLFGRGKDVHGRRQRRRRGAGRKRRRCSGEGLMAADARRRDCGRRRIGGDGRGDRLPGNAVGGIQARVAAARAVRALIRGIRQGRQFRRHGGRVGGRGGGGGGVRSLSCCRRTYRCSAPRRSAAPRRRDATVRRASRSAATDRSARRRRSAPRARPRRARSARPGSRWRSCRNCRWPALSAQPPAERAAALHWAGKLPARSLMRRAFALPPGSSPPYSPAVAEPEQERRPRGSRSMDRDLRRRSSFSPGRLAAPALAAPSCCCRLGARE